MDDAAHAAADDVVDSHVHVWDANRVDYPWMAEDPQLARRYDLRDVEDEHTAAGTSRMLRTVLATTPAFRSSATNDKTVG